MKKIHKRILLFITLFGWLTYIVAVEPRNVLHINEGLRKVLNLPALAIITYAGIIGLRYETHKWVKYLWLLVYIFEITMLLGFGTINMLATSNVTSNFRNFVSSLRHFLISPLPYAVLLYLLKVANKAPIGNAFNNEKIKPK